MGVTVHFEGTLKSTTDFNEVINKATVFATDNNFEFEIFEFENKKLYRVKDDADWDYEGATKGIKIKIDSAAEPLILEFDSNLHLQEYCKTQYASIKVHMKLIAFLRTIKLHFVMLEVLDEGEYWELNDVPTLQKNITDAFKVVEKAKKENPNLNGPYVTDDDRIVDLM
ncbi:MAG: hypothetical protein H7331_08805 [Bacteroidia bacterium]|nr:hypothetical protein [Bacteroidia bacterium]